VPEAAANGSSTLGTPGAFAPHASDADGARRAACPSGKGGDSGPCLQDSAGGVTFCAPDPECAEGETYP
jgi:hypothetical protein